MSIPSLGRDGVRERFTAGVLDFQDDVLSRARLRQDNAKNPRPVITRVIYNEDTSTGNGTPQECPLI